MSTVCPRCGEAASGKFCSSCGSSLAGAACPHCGGALTPGAQFCNHCGTSMSGGQAAPAPAGGGSRLPWILAGVALVAVMVLVLMQTASTSGAVAGGDGTAPVAPFAGSAPAGGGMPSAADIASMSPEEKADRLFNRIMMYASEGKRDSAAIFAPMAFQSYEMIGTLGAHQHFDLGLIAIAVGDATRARSEADAILKKNPTDLLGLTLAIRSAELARNDAARAGFEKRLISAEPTERKNTRQDYVDHGNDIDAALKDARSRKP
ncbi:MAG: double zinc ribbon domain-containing protein [Gemmatimonadaceae bacterium]